MRISEKLVQGVDVWINTPRRPWEASGTSGMKVLVNGGINLSELDGWWAEAYTPEIGWAIGDGHEHVDDTAWDAIEAEQLYSILEQKVAPEFYHRNKKGIPTAWISRMRESMAKLTPRFSADRSVREYTERHYLPGAAAYLERAANKGEKGKQLADTMQKLEQHWDSIHFGEVYVETIENQHLFEVQLFFKDLDPETLQVELFSDGLNEEAPSVQIMNRGKMVEGELTGYQYHTSVSAARPVSDFTARVIPTIPTVSVPLEISKILWEH